MNCKCTFAQHMVGDGCDICNPERAAEIQRENLQEAVDARWPDQFQVDLMRQAAKRELSRKEPE